MASANGLRHPASASCLGRHLRLAGRCPNNSSLFPPLAAVVVVASHIQRKDYFTFGVQESLRTFLNPIFTGRGRKGKRHLQAFSGLNSLSQNLRFCRLPRGGSLWHGGKVSD